MKRVFALFRFASACLLACAACNAAEPSRARPGSRRRNPDGRSRKLHSPGRKRAGSDGPHRDFGTGAGAAAATGQGRQPRGRLRLFRLDERRKDRPCPAGGAERAGAARRKRLLFAGHLQPLRPGADPGDPGYRKREAGACGGHRLDSGRRRHRAVFRCVARRGRTPQGRERSARRAAAHPPVGRPGQCRPLLSRRTRQARQRAGQGGYHGQHRRYRQRLQRGPDDLARPECGRQLLLRRPKLRPRSDSRQRARQRAVGRGPPGKGPHRLPARRPAARHSRLPVQDRRPEHRARLQPDPTPGTTKC